MKIALVTGGTGKIGKEIIRYLIDEDYKVVATFHKSFNEVENIKSSINQSKNNLLFFQCDLKEIKNIEYLYQQFKSNFTSLDLLINCAGIFSKNEFNKTTEEEFDSVMNINLKSNYFLIQKFFDLMTENSVVINFSSVGGIIPWRNRSLYHISKAGVIALTRSLALELAPKTRVVSIAPGFIESETKTDEKMPLSKIPLGRYGSIKDIIQTIDFIIKNDYITGLTIPVDGGRTLI